MRTSSKAVVALLLAAGLLQGCGSGRDPDGPLRGVDPAGGFVVSDRESVVDRPWSVGAIRICMQEAGTAVIEAVRPQQVIGAVAVDRFGLRANRSDEVETGGSHEPLPTLGFGDVNGFAVTASCAADQPGPELAIQLHRTGTGGGAVDGIVVDYRVGDQEYQLVNKLVVVACDPDVPGAAPEELRQDCPDAD
ncbi:hypothetical protein [Catellatospora sp. TT07R-123]|uniref:hypothetical protein n=1 Tax=Catellatospora sp. TT07R-123 TaxID=2733863 RepID=UPI001BB2F441|nr:hypothetical protein [Catellatospora sp. TT07R-123]